MIILVYVFEWLNPGRFLYVIIKSVYLNKCEYVIFNRRLCNT